MGFSVTGLIIAAVILAPNLVFVVFPPRHMPQGLKSAGLFFTICERIGQAACTILLILSGNAYQAASVDVWFLLMAVCIAVYYGLWIRYFIGGREFALAFHPLWLVPIPMAIFPILAFGFAAVWVQSLWLGIAAVLLAVGHFANSWAAYQYTK